MPDIMNLWKTALVKQSRFYPLMSTTNLLDYKRLTNNIHQYLLGISLCTTQNFDTKS